MIESWILGDKNSFKKIYGKIPSAMPYKPEFVWGAKTDAGSDYPKNLLDRVLNEVNDTSSQYTFCMIAEQIDINELKKTCPLSFGKLVEDLQVFN